MWPPCSLRSRPPRGGRVNAFGPPCGIDMKVLNLRCAHDHRFEGWFASDDDYTSQLARGLVGCPLCADTAIERLPSAPRLNVANLREQPAAHPDSQPVAMQDAWMRAVRHVMAEHRGRRRTFRRGGPAHPLRRKRRPRHPRSRHARGCTSHCGRRASRVVAMPDAGGPQGTAPVALRGCGPGSSARPGRAPA